MSNISIHNENAFFQMRKAGELDSIQQVVTRAAKLADKGDLNKDFISASEVVNSELFEKSSEFGMLKILDTLEPIVLSSDKDRYIKLVDGLRAGSKALAAFFDGQDSVMVMVDDIDVRRNRLNLLGVLRNQASILADFNRIK